MAETAYMPPRLEDQLWTAERFLDWLEPGVKAELIDGEKHVHTPVSLKHSRLTNFISTLLTLFVEKHRLGEIHREVVAVRLSARNVFMPDIAFFASDQVPRLHATFASEAPRFAIEVVSPSSEERDTNWKFAKYEAYGVDEYWILDPEHLAHRFYRRDGELLVEFAQDAEKVHSTVIKGFWIGRSWLNPDRMPEVSRCFAEITGTPL